MELTNMFKPVPTRIDATAYDGDVVREYNRRPYVNPKYYLCNVIANYEREFASEYPSANVSWMEWLGYALSFWRYAYTFGVDKIADRYRLFVSGRSPNADWREDIKRYLGVPEFTAKTGATTEARTGALALMSDATYYEWYVKPQTKE